MEHLQKHFVMHLFYVFVFKILLIFPGLYGSTRCLYSVGCVKSSTDSNNSCLHALYHKKGREHMRAHVRERPFCQLSLFTDANQFSYLTSISSPPTPIVPPAFLMCSEMKGHDSNICTWLGKPKLPSHANRSRAGQQRG